MNDEKIQRINELYRKSKEVGLTDAEKEEQQTLRQEYITAIRNNLRGTLQNVSILNPDGTVTDLSKKEISNKKN